ncbi:hypothetical protein EPUS_07835 [Endocarpon pusillum Z07020]|uniref:Aminoglycoside phosphotransferase domain-containing protein n=1 Tax=Endocarpon pusillum (strain Z07020 / HMAS-L-300199) TaxID=1263415 RepID=U1GCK3_ENDPU|nr:uncharacterized protein EPUS_07835 [Endocarpon pusillum Z07020]ERF69431.1 hypothetical protein EPUS_07835 [Endocarpon pusillum Z07020]
MVEPIDQPQPVPSIHGDLLPNIGWKKNVFKSSTESGEIVAKKVHKRWKLLESEVWKKINTVNKKLIIHQLRTEILKMRASTKPLIGRVAWNGDIEKDDPYPDPYHSDTTRYTVNYFGSEAEFDAHKVEQMRARRGDAAAKALEDRIKPLRDQYSERFVLTHGDLHSQNVHVRRVVGSDGKSRWELSGILDWGSSGLYPKYMEYAMAMKTGPHRPYWKKVMKEVLQGMECSRERMEVEERATECVGVVGMNSCFSSPGRVVFGYQAVSATLVAPNIDVDSILHTSEAPLYVLYQGFREAAPNPGLATGELRRL